MAMLSSDFLSVGPVGKMCDNKAALSLRMDRNEGQQVNYKHIDEVHHSARDRVTSVELSFLYRKSEENVSHYLIKRCPDPCLRKVWTD
jgi:hypothetical protein